MHYIITFPDQSSYTLSLEDAAQVYADRGSQTLHKARYKWAIDHPEELGALLSTFSWTKEVSWYAKQFNKGYFNMSETEIRLIREAR